MNRCPFCGAEVSDTAVACDHCGRDLLVPQTDPLALRKFRELRAGLRAGPCARLYQLKNPEPTAFEVWTRPTGPCVPLLVALLLLGVVPGIVYLVMTRGRIEQRAFRIEIRGRSRIFRDERDITDSRWLRAHLADP